jgi:macrophage erythroblast attacher
LVDLFKDEFCKLYGMTTDSLLNIHLQAGLSALKTPYPLRNCWEIACLTGHYLYMLLKTCLP